MNWKKMASFLSSTLTFIVTLIPSPPQYIARIRSPVCSQIFNLSFLTHPNEVFRAYTINSSYTSLHKEIEKLKSIFKQNAYPSNFVDKCILRFFNKTCGKRLPIHTAAKREVKLILPFLGSTSWRVKNELIRTIHNLLPYCKLNIVFKTSNRLSSYFPFKDKLPVTLDSGVIYRFRCACCNACYIGCTRRYWLKRLEEHTHISALTGKALSGLQVFPPLNHAKYGGCYSSTSISRDNFEILGRESNNYLLQIKESLFIYKYKPGLNGNKTSVPLSLFT